jgi:hypothetical protein
MKSLQRSQSLIVVFMFDSQRRKSPVLSRANDAFL